MAVLAIEPDEEILFEPQPGPQTQFLASEADIVIYGGEAGGGKTFALLLETLRCTDNPDSSCLILKRTKKMVRQKGGLWDETFKFYPKYDSKIKSNGTFLTWTFPSGAMVGFDSMQYDKDKYNYDGVQLPVICFDELQHFTEEMFFYMFSRNRSGQCQGIKPYIRATCNPKPKSWLKKFILWWLDSEGRYADKSKSGKIRWFIRDGNKIVWADTKEELLKAFPESDPTSVTFIPSSLEDNPALLKNDPGYKAKLAALPMFERLRLKGDWKVEPGGGNVFKKTWFKELLKAPNNIIEIIRYWDRAGTEKKEEAEKRQAKGKDPDYTSGVLMCRTLDDFYAVLDRVKFRATAGDVRKRIRNISEQDRMNFQGIPYSVGIEQDPGQAGLSEAKDYIRILSGFNVKLYPARQQKIVRAAPLSSQVENGHVGVVQAEFTEDYLEEMHVFPDGAHDDDVDASSGAFNALSNNPTGQINQIKTKDKIKDYRDKK